MSESLEHHLPIADGTVVGRRARALVRRHGRAIAVILCLQVLAVVAGLVPPVLLGGLVQALSSGTSLPLDAVVLAILVALVTHGALVYSGTFKSFELGETVFARLREDFVAGLLQFPLGRLERVGTGEILSRSTSDMDAIHDIVRTGLPEFAIGILTTVLTIVAAFVINPLLAVACIVGLPFIWISTKWYVGRAPQAYAADLAAQADVSTEISETVRGAETVAAMDLGKHRNRAMREAVGRARETALRPIGLDRTWFPFVQVGYRLPVLAVLAWGAILATHEMASVGQIAAITIYMQSIVRPLDDVIFWFGEVQSARAALARILGVELAPAPEPATGVPLDGSVDVSSVWFRYADLAQDVVRDVSLKIPDGCRFAIVGVSGSGKSTLISMIAGIERPRVGRVRVGGFDLRSAATSDLTNHVVMLAQEDHVFYGSVRDNLTLSDPSASDEALWEALDMAGAREWAEALDDGLDTALGDDAAPVEVDRARQLALARLFLKRPKVLLLDEATAPLSRLEEDSLLQALEERLPGVTVIQVAHSLRAAERADTVAVMSAGAVVELGSHEELSRGDGAYAQAWKAWRDAEAEGDFPRSSNGGGLAL